MTTTMALQSLGPQLARPRCEALPLQGSGPPRPAAHRFTLLVTGELGLSADRPVGLILASRKTALQAGGSFLLL